ncbi:hypothetical protein GCM10019017_23810 [Streptomyces showdoensis]
MYRFCSATYVARVDEPGRAAIWLVAFLDADGLTGGTIEAASLGRCSWPGCHGAGLATHGVRHALDCTCGASNCVKAAYAAAIVRWGSHGSRVGDVGGCLAGTYLVTS